MTTRQRNKIILGLIILIIVGVFIFGLWPRNRRAPGPLRVWLIQSEHDRLAANDPLFTILDRETGVDIEIKFLPAYRIVDYLLDDSPDLFGRVDVVEVPLSEVHKVWDKVMALDELIIESESYVSDPYGLMSAGYFESSLRFLPFRVRWQAMIYNAEDLPEPPRDWRKFLAWMKDNPFEMCFKGLDTDDLTSELLIYLWSYGAGPLDLDSPEAEQAFDNILRMAEYTNVDSSIMNSESALDAQLDYEIGIHINWSTQMNDLVREGMAPIPMRSAPIPQGPNGSFTSIDGGFMAIPHQAPHPKEGLGMILYLMSAKVQAKLLNEYGWMPVTPQSWDSVTNVRRQAFNGFLQMARNTKIPPTQVHDPRVSKLLRETFRDIVFEEIPVQQTLRKNANQIQDQLE